MRRLLYIYSADFTEINMRCKKCKRLSGIGGAACTPYKCVLCGKESIWGSTAHPDLCPNCMTKAVKNKDGCHWCGTLFEDKENNNESN